MSIGDQRLVARASRGDVDAFSILVREHSGLVHRVALRVLGAEDAQDATQEVWIRVWPNIKNFRGESAFTIPRKRLLDQSAGKRYGWPSATCERSMELR